MVIFHSYISLPEGNLVPGGFTKQIAIPTALRYEFLAHAGPCSKPEAMPLSLSALRAGAPGEVEHMVPVPLW